MKTKVKIPTVRELRQDQGYKVRVTHYRKTSKNSDLYSLAELRDGEFMGFVESKGGKTVVEIRSPDGAEVRGESICNDNDAFCKKYGRNLAIARALGLKDLFKGREKGDVVYFTTKFFTDSLSIQKGIVEEYDPSIHLDKEMDNLEDFGYHMISTGDEWFQRHSISAENIFNSFEDAKKHLLEVCEKLRNDVEALTEKTSA